MNKKYIIVTCLIVIMVIAGLILLNNRNEKLKDSYIFKTEYEKINGEKNAHGKVNRTVHISKNNPMKYITVKKLMDKINNGETFAIYFGFSDCPWCRSIVENLIAAAKNKKVDTIYYLDVKELRDIKEIKNGEVVETKKGNKYYIELLNKLDSVLSEYILEDEQGNEVNTGEKRIYDPNIVSIVNGKPKELTDGTSSKENDPYMKLTKSMNNESIKKIECILKCLNETNVCTSKTSC